MSTITHYIIQINFKVISKPVESGVIKTLKSQNPSTKFQINLKFQYPMTKTSAEVPRRCQGNLGLLSNLPFGTNTIGACVCNFEFGSLGFV
jgi:hypothetical protein